jgi:putative membrane protein
MANPQVQARRTHEKIKQSAAVLKASATEQTDSADRRTELAADRTIFAAERTYAAWVRTGLAALASGIGARALLDGVIVGWLIRSTGAVLILFAGFCFVAAVWRELLPSVQPPKPRARRLPAALLVAINGFLVLVALAAFAGVAATRPS